MMLLKAFTLSLALILSPAPRATPAAGSAAKSGTYVAKSLNRSALPAVERISAGDGYTHWVKVEQLILRLQSNGQFSVSMRYYHEYLRPKEPGTASQMLNDSNRGSYTVSGDELTFTPVAKGGRAPRPIAAEVHGDEIVVKFRVREGDHWRPMTVVAVRDRSYL